MGARAGIAIISKDRNKVLSFYSHWGADNLKNIKEDFERFLKNNPSGLNNIFNDKIPMVGKTLISINQNLDELCRKDPIYEINSFDDFKETKLGMYGDEGFLILDLKSRKAEHSKQDYVGYGEAAILKIKNIKKNLLNSLIEEKDINLGR